MLHSKVIKSVAAAAMLAVAPIAASAATVVMNPGDSYSLDTDDVYRFDSGVEFGGSDAGGASYYFEFTASSLPQPTLLNTTVNVNGDFDNLEVLWSYDTVADAGDVAVDVSGFSATNFTLTASPVYLLVSYDAVNNGGDIDLRVAAVPLPAGGVLLMTALAGFGVARRRKKA